MFVFKVGYCTFHEEPVMLIKTQKGSSTCIDCILIKLPCVSQQ